MTMPPFFREILTGRTRPRHGRFARAFAELCAEKGWDHALQPVTFRQRLVSYLGLKVKGFRQAVCAAEKSVFLILHQSLGRGSAPYVAEFDIPLALHGYDSARHRRAHHLAQAHMEQSTCRALWVFSDWARRSFALHYGTKVGAKTRTIYPLAFEGATIGPMQGRAYDFTFVSINFRIKAGSELIRAFKKVREVFPLATLCVVTKLDSARHYLGDLSAYEGVAWCEARLNESQIAELLANTRCLVHPSLSDSFGVVVLEALAAGCAIITTDMASFPEMVEPANGWLLPVPQAAVVGDSFTTEFGDVAYHSAYLDTLHMDAFEGLIASRMTDFLSDTAEAEKKMRASCALFEKRFSRQAWKNRMESALREAFPEIDGMSP